MSHKLYLNTTKQNICKVQIACGFLFVVVGWDGEKIRFFFEVNQSEGGGCEANLQALAKLCTRWWSDGRLNRDKIIKDLEEITCRSCMRWKGKLIGQGKSIEGVPNSCANAIAKVLKEMEIKNE